MNAKEFLDRREFNVLVKGTPRKVTLHNTDLERLLEEYAKQSVEQSQISEEEIKVIFERYSSVGSADTEGNVYYSKMDAMYFSEAAKAIYDLIIEKQKA